jgi:uncharacterized protein (UPF0332 family)
MSIERLVQAGSIHPFRATSDEVDKALQVARRDLALAENILSESLDWSYSIAYNAVLQACRAYMFHLGYRPASSAAHKATFEFMQIAVDQPLKRAVSYFDRVRKKRHRIIYNEVGLVTEKEARELLKKARGFISYIGRKLGKL